MRREGSKTDDTAGVEAYLIDVSELDTAPERLELTWEGAAEGGFAASLDVESSDDLAQWRTVVAGATLADLRSGGAALVRRDVVLPAHKAKYLRLTWPAPLREVRLTGVRAVFRAQEEPPARETLVIAGRPAVDGAAYEFDTGGVRPVDRVRVVFSERNAALGAVLLSRPSPAAEWRRQRTATFYNLERNGSQVQGEPIALAPVSDRYWRIETEGGQAWPGGPPSLEIRWVPDLLTAIAQGEGPFTVAFGSATVEPAGPTTDRLLDIINSEQEQDLISAARVSEVFALGGIHGLRRHPRRCLGERGRCGPSS